MASISSGNQTLFDTLLERRASINMQIEGNGTTALMTAAEHDRERMLNLLLDHRVSPDLQDKDGVSALMAAATKGHERIVVSLLEHAASPSLQEKMASVHS